MNHITQDKLLRTLILECIGLAVHAFLRRQPRGDGTAARGRTDAWLARTTKPIMVNVRKGNFQFPEQQVLLVSFVPHDNHRGSCMRPSRPVLCINTALLRGHAMANATWLPYAPCSLQQPPITAVTH